jgi:hypothetical protein
MLLIVGVALVPRVLAAALPVARPHAKPPWRCPYATEALGRNVASRTTCQRTRCSAFAGTLASVVSAGSVV